MIKYTELLLREIYFTLGLWEYTTDNKVNNIYLWLIYHMQSFQTGMVFLYTLTAHNLWQEGNTKRLKKPVIQCWL